MTQFHLPQATNTKVLDVQVLSQKNRQPDEDPGAKISLELQLTNHVLDSFDPSLRTFLYGKAPGSESAKTATLDGVPEVSDLPNLTPAAMKIPVLQWKQELSGYRLVIDQGLGGKKSDLEVTDCLLSGFRFFPKEGGTLIAKCSVESANVDGAQWGRLAKLKSRQIEVKLFAPQEAQSGLPLEGDKPPAGADPKDSPTGGAFPAAGQAGRASSEPPPQSATVEKPSKDSKKAAEATKAFVAGAAPATH